MLLQAGPFKDKAPSTYCGSTEAGFVGIELYAANGYLIEQFLNANVKRRSDAYAEVEAVSGPQSQQRAARHSRFDGSGASGTSYASPAYLARNGVPELPKDLLRHDCIAMESQLSSGLWNFRSGDVGGPVTVTPRVRVTDIVIAREMAAAGVGVAILTHATCTAEVRAGVLVQVLSDWSLPTVPIFATFLERRHLPRRIRAFLDLIGEAIRREPNVE